MIAKRLPTLEFFESHANAFYEDVFQDGFDLKSTKPDFCSIIWDDDAKKGILFGTIRSNSGNAHIEYGGAFSEYRGGVKSAPAFAVMLEDLFTDHQSISLATRNNNFPMLKLALKFGFIINGIEVMPDFKIFVHMSLQKGVQDAS